MVNQVIEKNVSKFKIDLLRKMPFYGDILINLSIEQDLSIETACTNGMNIRYSPKFFSTLSPGQQNFVIMHEVFHILLCHCQRDTGKDPRIWNMAADLVVNNMLMSDLTKDMTANNIPFERPSDGLFSLINNQSVEDIYAKILEDNSKTSKSSKRLILRSNYSRWGSSKDSEIEVPSDLKPEPMTIEEKQLMKSMLQEMVRNASNAGRSPYGHCTVPDMILNINSKNYFNWKKMFRDFMQEERSDESSYATPERKYIHMDLILPGHETSEEVVEEVWAFVDSSGSIEKGEMEAFLSELYAISKQFKCVMNICYWDTEVGDVYQGIKSEKQLKDCLPHHSGGTDINCVYKWIRDNKVKPDIMLILTDGMYGRVNNEIFIPSLKKKTILIISDKKYIDDSMHQIGKVASF